MDRDFLFRKHCPFLNNWCLTVTTENGATRAKRNIRDHDLNDAHELRIALTLLY